MPQRTLSGVTNLSTLAPLSSRACRKRYRWMAIQCHPDKCSRKDATKQQGARACCGQLLVVIVEAVVNACLLLVSSLGS